MSDRDNRFNPFDADRPLMMRCSCGGSHAPEQYDSGLAVTPPTSAESYSRDFIEATLVKALLPSEPLRRRFLQAVRAGNARAAIASLLPLGALEAMAQEGGKGAAALERRDLGRCSC